MAEIVLTSTAADDLRRLPDEVGETFLSKMDAAEKNMEIGATPRQTFDKYLSGNMHPVLQMNLGRDYRAWLVEGERFDFLEDDRIYCFNVLQKPEAEEMASNIGDARDYLESVL